MTRLLRAVLPLVVLLAATGRPLSAQAPPAPLERFVQTVGQLWMDGNAGTIAAVVQDGQLLLDTGRGGESVNGRHAAAALRELFGESETVSVRPVRVTLAGGQPPRGFGELAWVFRARGSPVTQTRSVYVGAVWTGRDWRISEIRLMP